MGFPGRKRRLRNFGKRAEAFAREERYGGEWIERDYKPILVGRGKHRRLAAKDRPMHFEKIIVYVRNVEKKFRELEASPETRLKHLFLEPLEAVPGLGVQEYVNKPSMAALIDFMKAKKSGHKSQRLSLPKEENALCRQFLGQHRGITLQKLYDARKEAEQLHQEAGILGYNFSATNLIIRGLKRDGRVNASLADI